MWQNLGNVLGSNIIQHVSTMTTSSRRSVEFVEVPEIINDKESQFDGNDSELSEDDKHESAGQVIMTPENKPIESIVEVHVDGNTMEQNDTRDISPKNTTKYVSELFIDISGNKENKTRVVIGGHKQNLLPDHFSQSSAKYEDKTDIIDNSKTNQSESRVTIEHPSYSSTMNQPMETADSDSSISGDSLSNVSDMSQVLKESESDNKPSHSAVAIENNKVPKIPNGDTNRIEHSQTDTEPLLSYTSFPGQSNFVLVSANDWLKQRSEYDKDGFVLQSNFGHVDFKSKAGSRPWLSEFRKTAQRVYVTPNGKVVENISVQDHDGKAYITSYHTNKELKSVTPTDLKSDVMTKEDLEEEIERGHRDFNHVSCLFYNLILLGTLLVVGITLLIVYTV